MTCRTCLKFGIWRKREKNVWIAFSAIMSLCLPHHQHEQDPCLLSRIVRLRHCATCRSRSTSRNLRRDSSWRNAKKRCSKHGIIHSLAEQCFQVRSLIDAAFLCNQCLRLLARARHEREWAKTLFRGNGSWKSKSSVSEHFMVLGLISETLNTHAPLLH